MLSHLLKEYNVILGSKSPRRQQFLKDLEIPYQIRTADTNEVYDSKLQGPAITEYLSELKAKAIPIKNNELLITADTIVWANNTALGKPKNYEEAVAMLTLLANNKHEVISSICLKTNQKTKLITDTTTVYFNPLTRKEIEHYINTYQPFDKAGSYGIQEWIGMVAVQKIEGNYNNVVGMPVHKLYTTLKNF